MSEERDDTTEYVAALRTSTDRARYSLYVVVVATVLVFIANYNISEDGWPRQRLDTWYSYATGTPPRSIPPPKIARGDPERLRELRTEYVKQFVSRAVFTTSPIPGVSIDINALGIFGGITLVLLMLVFTASMAREHENVYLAMYKVRLVWQTNPVEQSRGGSRANLLYHALAMTQVLNAPPTLARWRRPAMMKLFRVIFLSPALVYGWVVWSEWDTRDVRALYGVTTGWTLAFEVTMLLVLLALGALTWIHSSAMSDRWERAFYVVNPARRVAPQMTTAEWLRLGFGKKSEARLIRQRVANDVVDRLQIEKPQTAEVPIKPVVIPCSSSDRISRVEFVRLRNAILSAGEQEVPVRCTKETHESTDLAAFSVDRSVFDGRQWTVEGKWKYRCSDPEP